MYSGELIGSSPLFVIGVVLGSKESYLIDTEIIDIKKLLSNKLIAFGKKLFVIGNEK